MSLSGMSLTGLVTVIQSPSRASMGQLRSLYADSGFPATSFFDVFVEATFPASCYNCPPTVTKYNATSLHMTLSSGSLYYWPPASATYQMQAAASPTPTPGSTPPPGGVPACTAGVWLLPQLPEYVCIASASFTITTPPPPAGVGGVAELSGIEPAANTVPAHGAANQTAATIAAIAVVIATVVLGGSVFAYRRTRR